MIKILMYRKPIKMIESLTIGEDLVWLKRQFRLVLPNTCIQGSHSPEKDKSESLLHKVLHQALP